MRLASKIPVAGIKGRMDRAFTVQLKNAAKMNVPTTQSIRKSECPARCLQKSVTARAKVAIPPKIYKASCPPISIQCSRRASSAERPPICRPRPAQPERIRAEAPADRVAQMSKNFFDHKIKEKNSTVNAQPPVKLAATKILANDEIWKVSRCSCAKDAARESKPSS